MMLRKFFNSLFDFYLGFAILCNVLLVVVFIFLDSHYFIIDKIKFSDGGKIHDLYPSLVSTNISLLGFLIAALTIIITFKSNLTAKLKEVDFEQLNGLDLILSSKHYKTIVNLFKKALYELILFFVILMLTWVLTPIMDITYVYYAIFYTFLGIVLVLLRILIVLFKILKLDKS